MKDKSEASTNVEKEEKLTAEELKIMKALESGKFTVEKAVEEDMAIKGKDNLKWYLENDYDISPTQGLVWKDYPMISKQRGVVFHLIKQVGANLLKGKSIMSVSLPISIMQPLTLLQRTADAFCYLPCFAERLATNDPVERLKHCIALLVSSLHLSLDQRKPLNPVLGETYQGYFGSDKFSVYCEQISHHPPISNIIIDCPVLTMYLSRNIEARTYPNSATIKSNDTGKTVFKDAQNTTYKVLSSPDLKIGGVMMGNRTVSYQGFLTMADETNKLYAQIRFDPEKQGFFEKVFKKTEGHRSDFFKGFITKNQALLKDESRKAFYSKDIIAYMEGNWLENIKIDGDVYWEIGKEEPASLIDAKVSLDSDSTKRPDAIALKQNKEEEAQNHKEELEDIQRKDRKLREIASKQKK